MGLEPRLGSQAHGGSNTSTITPTPQQFKELFKNTHEVGVAVVPALLMLIGISACAVFPSQSHTASPSASALAFNPVVLGTRMVQPINVNEGAF